MGVMRLLYRPQDRTQSAQKLEKARIIDILSTILSTNPKNSGDYG